MLRTRLWMGGILIGVFTGTLVFDRRLQPWYPFLFLTFVVLSGIACGELLHLMPAARRPAAWLCFGAVGAMVAANWVVALETVVPLKDADPWHWLLGVMMVAGVLATLTEMARFRSPGESVTRIGLTLFVVFYLGLLPSFLARLRWSGDGAEQATRGSVALALAIFVPKLCDVGAYFTGRSLGKHPMAPVLSPKKTVEGAAGGIVAATLATIAIDRLGPVLPNLAAEVGFGVTVGGAGMLGDLAESLIKRDFAAKDASQIVPGFGGVLDLVDAVLFAAPVAYLWLTSW